MIVHTVLFWLDRKLSDADRAACTAAASSLKDIPAVRHCWVGAPAATARPVVDRTYDFALTVTFDDLAGHDAYQVHPLHQEFLKSQSSKWIRVVITDAEGPQLKG